jgi:uncharacterized protein (DUF1499 family)
MRGRTIARRIGLVLAVLIAARLVAAIIWPTINDIKTGATPPVFRFKDDVTVTIAREGDATVVNVRSHSRIGKGDLGANARRIRLFQADLARRVP